MNPIVVRSYSDLVAFAIQQQERNLRDALETCRRLEKELVEANEKVNSAMQKRADLIASTKCLPDLPEGL